MYDLQTFLSVFYLISQNSISPFVWTWIVAKKNMGKVEKLFTWPTALNESSMEKDNFILSHQHFIQYVLKNLSIARR